MRGGASTVLSPGLVFLDVFLRSEFVFGLSCRLGDGVEIPLTGSALEPGIVGIVFGGWGGEDFDEHILAVDDSLLVVEVHSGTVVKKPGFVSRAGGGLWLLRPKVPVVRTPQWPFCKVTAPERP